MTHYDSEETHWAEHASRMEAQEYRENERQSWAAIDAEWTRERIAREHQP